ncbi:AI-2E family transporter [Clostridium formicaceticum]|uniref:AI-2 transport protein TqsA n=1 Tax=Clostridium formicaceticum TaxID=1497 RepID=A0AAC9RPY4_9CLOT|nr:AI-2E family transporter [Clostridium formicaceticum]AOY75203.1 AI-2E family transporter [Clostridium formicaceticum]ARE89634.1 AI-2 transport protein TqsA [Clostridium formicaceticum]
MKIRWDKQYLKYSLYASFAVILPILFFQVLDNIGSLLANISGSFSWIRRVLSPFIMGGFIAYILNPGVRWFEKKLYREVTYINERKKLHRFLSIITVYAILLGLITMLLIFVVPQIANNIREIIQRLPEYDRSTRKWIANWENDMGLNNLYNIAEYIEKNSRDIFDIASQVLEYLLNNIVSSIMTVTSGILNFLLAMIISFYMLSDKEAFKVGSEKFLRAVMKDETVDRARDFGREADELFGKFIIGKSLDSFIIGVLCFIGLNIMGIRYSLLLSSIIGITNMIPYFGPFIGGVPAVIITFFDSPIKAFWVTLFVLALQQFDGLFLGPKILGDSVGLRPFWIVFAIVVGGKLAGVLGMFLGVPIFAIIRLVVLRLIDQQLERKKEKKLNNTL